MLAIFLNIHSSPPLFIVYKFNTYNLANYKYHVSISTLTPIHRNKSRNQILHTIANYYNTAKHFCKNFMHSYAIKSYTFYYYFCQVGNGSYPNCNKTCGTSTNTQFSTKSSFSRRHQSQTRIKTRS